jgi:hypothetical protein
MSTITTASRQYATRPADERFNSLPDLLAHSLEMKNHCAERGYNLKDLRVEPREGNDLALVSPKGAATFTNWSFGQLARTVGAPAAYLRDLPPALAADCLNFGLQDSPVGTSATILARGANGAPPVIRSVTSESYGRLWDADLYSGVTRLITDRDKAWGLPPVWGGGVAGAYAGDRDSFLIVTNGGSIVTDPSLSGKADNQLFRGLMIRNSEVGASSVVIEAILYRYICGNHMLWGATVDRAFRRRHVGSHVLRDTIREIGTIAYKWVSRSAAQDQALIQTLIDKEIASTREAVIDELRAMGATKEQAENAYASCERFETASPRSFWGVAQGLTRLSQTDSGYQDERYNLDKLAGLVLAKGAKVAA